MTETTNVVLAALDRLAENITDPNRDHPSYIWFAPYLNKVMRAIQEAGVDFSEFKDDLIQAGKAGDIGLGATVDGVLTEIPPGPAMLALLFEPELLDHYRVIDLRRARNTIRSN